MDALDTKTRRKEERLDWIAERLGGRVLDLGCGPGELAARAVARGHDYLGVDADPMVLKKAQDNLQSIDGKSRARFQRIDVDALEIDGLFDTLVLAEVLEHVPDPVRVLTRAARFLAVGAQLIVSTPFGWMPDPDHKRAPFASDIEGWLREVDYVPVEVSVGDYHVRVRARPGTYGGVDPRAVLRETEREAEAVQRFWIGERDRQAGRVERLIARTEALVEERDRERTRAERAERRLHLLLPVIPLKRRFDRWRGK